MAQRAEEVWTHMQAKHIDKHHQAERLGVVEHLRIDRQSDVSGQNSNEEHEGHAQRHTSNANLAKCKTHTTYQRQHDHRLQR